MPKVIEIAVSENPKGQMKSVNNVETVAGKGLVNHYHFKNDSEKRRQITLIEIENINHYNQITRTSIPPKDFRRNIVTEGIKLNALVGSEFFIGKVKVKAHDLCRPCKYLQESLNQKNLIKAFLQKGGLRCEIITNGKIFVGDEIKNYI